ncbi:MULTISPECIES: four-carbon acid sugar kinase family protein [unclassified Halomonas]|uniref:four-carbon acid sugar kinase family protein n=1 Tax=unclassified Halomonas TaxID=2609666 RepID=UPI0040348799
MSLSDTARLIILADDLSGAADCAVSYARSGSATVIELALQNNVDAQVLVFDTDSRHLDATEAAKLNVEAWRAVRQPGLRLYKKIDSTLRGNWAQEVAALIPEVGMAVVAPAMPAMKRFTRDARQFIDHTPVEETPVWGNEERSGKASLSDMLVEAEINVAHLSLATLRESSTNVLRQWLLKHQQNQIEAVVCDAESDADLEHLAEATHTLDRIFWVGSAGLSTALCPYLGRDAGTALMPPITIEGPVLMVVGSMSSVSHRQVDYLLTKRGKALEHFQVDIADLLTLQDAPFALKRAQQALEAGHDVLVSLTQQAPDPSIDGYALTQRLASHLGNHISLLGALVATGGETAKALLSAAGINHLHLVDELEPGVALSVNGQGMPVVTKAGAFGSETTLYEAWRTLVDKRPSSSCRC